MIKIETWLKPTKEIDEPIKAVISDRYIDSETGEPAEWTFTPLASDKVDLIQESCMEKVQQPLQGTFTRELNTFAYVNKLAAATVTDPNLSDPQLQERYGTKNTRDSRVNTLGRMLNAKEKNVLVRVINEIYELNPDLLEEMVDDAKNE